MKIKITYSQPIILGGNTSLGTEKYITESIHHTDDSNEPFEDILSQQCCGAVGSIIYHNMKSFKVEVID